MAGRDILASLLMGVGGLSQQYGQGLERRAVNKENMMDVLTKLYMQQLLDQQDPYKQQMISESKARELSYGRDKGFTPSQELSAILGATEQENVPIDLQTIFPKRMENDEEQFDKENIKQQIMGLDPRITEGQATRLVDDYLLGTSEVGENMFGLNRDAPDIQKKLSEVLQTKRSIPVPTNKARKLQELGFGNVTPEEPFITGSDNVVKILVKRKSDGIIGTINANEFDESLYERQ